MVSDWSPAGLYGPRANNHNVVSHIPTTECDTFIPLYKERSDRVTVTDVRRRFTDHTSLSWSLSASMSSSSKSCQPTRQPTCTRCRHHGIIVQRKGHMKFCPYLKCGCWRCFLITQRTRITALHRSQGGDRLPPQDTERQPCAQTGEVRPAVEGTVSGSAPDGGAPQSATPQLLISQPSGGAAAAAAAAAGAPPDLRGRPAAVDCGLAASASTEERSGTPSSMLTVYNPNTVNYNVFEKLLLKNKHLTYM